LQEHPPGDINGKEIASLIYMNMLPHQVPPKPVVTIGIYPCPMSSHSTHYLHCQTVVLLFWPEKLTFLRNKRCILLFSRGSCEFPRNSREIQFFNCSFQAAIAK
jgi:hypothetical protein